MAVSKSDVDNLIAHCNFLKVAEHLPDHPSGHRGFAVALKPQSKQDFSSLLRPFREDPTFAVSEPAHDVGLGDVCFIVCPARTCHLISAVAKDVRSHLGGGS